jgi:hypothetical protein
LCEKLVAKQISVHFICFDDQIADVLTKSWLNHDFKLYITSSLYILYNELEGARKNNSNGDVQLLKEW